MLFNNFELENKNIRHSLALLNSELDYEWILTKHFNCTCEKWAMSCF